MLRELSALTMSTNAAFKRAEPDGGDPASERACPEPDQECRRVAHQSQHNAWGKCDERDGNAHSHGSRHSGQTASAHPLRIAQA